MLFKKICPNCGIEFETKTNKKIACSKRCAKAIWKEKIKKLGTLVYGTVGRKKGITPWNKGKKCPQLSGENNPFYGKTHDPDTISKIINHQQETKSRNNTFNISQEEINVGQKLKQKFPQCKCQYKTTEYPFNCDFYIPSQDLYLECNFHWTHGIYNNEILGPFNSNDKKHQQILEAWKCKKNKIL